MPPKPNKQITRADRNRIVGQLQAGSSQTEVAAKNRVQQSTVSRIKRKFEEMGSVDDLERGGRPRKTTARQDRMIVLAVKKDPEITGKEIKKDLGLENVSSRLVRRRIYENSEIKSYWKTKKGYIKEAKSENSSEIGQSSQGSDTRAVEKGSVQRRVSVCVAFWQAFTSLAYFQPTI